jgi:hypothetical protein
MRCRFPRHAENYNVKILSRPLVRGLFTAAAFIVFLTIPGRADAQAGSGGLMGRVLSGQTGEPLAAVQVTVPSLGLGTLTDAGGRYILLNVPAGVHDLVIRSLGYAAKTVTGVEVTAGERATLDVTLDASAVAITGITVTAERERGSTSALLTERQHAAEVSDAIGAEQISRAPDGDVASALKRVPGVTVVDGKYVYVRGLGERYGATTLNGAPMPSPLPDRKAVPLDMIPSDLLESVVTAKSYLPNQPGDYAGGLVQIQTKTAPSLRTMQFSASTGYNTASSLQPSLGFSSGLPGFFGMTDGSMALPDGIFEQDEVTLPTEPGARQDLANSLTQRFGPASLERPLNQSYAVTFGDQVPVMGRPLGLIGTLTVSESYSSPENSVERLFVAAGDEPRQDYDFEVLGGSRENSLGGLVSASMEIMPAQRITAMGTYNRLTDDQARQFSGLYTGGDYFQTYNTRYVSSSIGNLQLRGDHVIQPFGNAVLGWRASYGLADRDEPGTRTAAYRGTGPGEPVYFLPSQSSGIVLAQRLDEELMSFAADLKLPFLFRTLPANLSFGASADLRDRNVDTRRILLSPVDDVAGAAALPPGELFVPERIGTESGQFLVDDRTFAADNYLADQQVRAGYAMVDVPLLPRLRAVGGVRIEQARQNVSITGFREAERSGVPATRLEDTDLIPAVNLTFAVTDRANLRAAASRTVARPQFRELSPFLYADYFGDVPVRGNPYLVRSTILNGDVRGEWFFRPGALISVGGFYKQFDDPIEPIAIRLGTNPGRTFANTESATVYGVELELRSGLGILAAALEPLTMNANVTLAASTVDGDQVAIYDPQQNEPLAYPVNRGESRPLFGQSPYAVNLGLSYFSDRTGTAATVLYNQFGRRVDTTGGVELPDIYEEGRSQLDVTVDQPLWSGISLKLSAARLLGGQVEFTQKFPNGDTVTTRAYDLGRTFSMSVSWKP